MCVFVFGQARLLIKMLISRFIELPVKIINSQNIGIGIKRILKIKYATGMKHSNFQFGRRQDFKIAGPNLIQNI